MAWVKEEGQPAKAAGISSRSPLELLAVWLEVLG
jgi:hypothetical protein